MLETSEDYGKQHNIYFSTNPNPNKSKTKCVLFHKQKLTTYPKNLLLNGNPLPWVKSFKYLGVHINDTLDGQKSDILAKRAQYIDKQSEINQLFRSAHPEVKC